MPPKQQQQTEAKTQEPVTLESESGAASRPSFSFGKSKAPTTAGSGAKKGGFSFTKPQAQSTFGGATSDNDPSNSTQDTAAPSTFANPSPPPQTKKQFSYDPKKWQRQFGWDPKKWRSADEVCNNELTTSKYVSPFAKAQQGGAPDSSVRRCSSV